MHKSCPEYCYHLAKRTLLQRGESLLFSCLQYAGSEFEMRVPCSRFHIELEFYRRLLLDSEDLETYQST